MWIFCAEMNLAHVDDRGTTCTLLPLLTDSRLRDRGLLEKQGAGSRTHYMFTSPGAHVDHDTVQGELPLEGGKRGGEGGKPDTQGGKRTLPDLPPELTAHLPRPGQRLTTEGLRKLIRDLCGWQPLRGEELAFLFPESPNHALQAYTLPASKGTTADGDGRGG